MTDEIKDDTKATGTDGKPSSNVTPITYKVQKERPKKTKPPRKPRTGWEASFEYDHNDRLRPSIGNVMTILEMHPEWQGVLAYDSFSECVTARRVPPQREQDRFEGYEPGEWTDTDTTRTAAWIGKYYDVDIGITTVLTAVVAVARRNQFHPVRDYVHAITWDRVSRLDTMLSRYFGAEQNAYTAQVGACLLLSAVARIEEPGCKVDTIIVLEGVQGAFKSTAVRILALDVRWFADTGLVLGDKDSYQNLRGVLLYEFAELLGIVTARDVERYKNFVSSAWDTYRPSYERRSQKIARQCIFIGTTNTQIYLFDKTGNRRFLPVRCGVIDIEALKADVLQLWAEALVRYTRGERWYIETADMKALCAEEQGAREQGEPWAQIIQRWTADGTVLIPNYNTDLQDRFDSVSICNGLTTTELLCGALRMQPDKITRSAEMRIADAMQQLKWSRRQIRLKTPGPDGTKMREWRYFPPEPNREPVTNVGDNASKVGDT